MQLLDIPHELFGGDAHKEGRTPVGNAQVAKGAGIAKHLNKRSLAMFACTSKTARDIASAMKADLPLTLCLHLIRLTPQMRALTAKSLFRNLGRIDEWNGGVAETAALAIRTEEDMDAAAMDDSLYPSPDAYWNGDSELEDHLPECAAVICDKDATQEELFEALKTDARTHPFWDTFAERNKEERWHQMPDPSYVHTLHCEAMQIYPETLYLPFQRSPLMPAMILWPAPWAVPLSGSLWCGKIDIENGEADGGWGVLMGPNSLWWGSDDGPAGFWRIAKDAPNWD